MTEKLNPEGSDRTSMIGSVHLSLSNIFSYTLVSATAALAFFVAFQATLLANFPSIQGALSSKDVVILSFHLPIGKIAISLVCLSILVFNYWSYKITILFGHYIRAFLVSGKTLERSANLSVGPFAAILEKFEQQGGVGHGSSRTRMVVVTISLVWALLGLLPWLSG